jgi:MFS family permease
LTALAGLHLRTFSSLKTTRNYRLYFMGQMVSLCGTWMADTALPWLIVERTHSPVSVGLLLFCRYLPFGLFGLHAGVFADRFDNRRLLMLTQLAAMFVSVALAVLTASNVQPLWAIYVLAMFGGAAAVFDGPCRNALIFQLVGRDALPNAVALNSGPNSASRVVGPALAGVVIAVAGVSACFAINAFSFVAVLIVLKLMRTSEFVVIERSGILPRGFAAIREGIAYVRTEPLVRFVILISALIGALGFNFRTLLPILAAKTLTVGAGVFGALYACFSAGALGGALFAASVSTSHWRRLVTGVGAFSIFMLMIAPLHTAWLIAILLVGVGVAFSFWASASMAILQLAAPDHLRGRVLSMWLFVFAGLTPIGSLLAGWLAAVGGTLLAFSFAGGAGLLATVVAFARTRTLDVAQVQSVTVPEPEFGFE